MAATATMVERTSQYAALAGTLRHMILDGRFLPHEPLPSIRELSDRHGVGVQVVRSALGQLMEEGLVYRREGRGTFVGLRNETGGESVVRPALRCITFVERPSGTSPGFVRTGYLQGYTEVLESLDTKMRILPCPEPEEAIEDLLSPNYPYQEQGVVLINLLSGPLMQKLADHQVPFVVQSNKAYDRLNYPPHHGVYINKVHGGFEATRYLLSLGHERIGFIGAVPRDQSWSHDVYGGYQSALACGGYVVHNQDVLDFGTNELAMAIGPVRDFLNRSDLPTAFMTQNDTLALAVLAAARQLGLRVPRDLSVVGFDDLPESEQSDPPLTTVANPRVRLGRIAVEMLLKASTGVFTEPQSRAMEGCLVMRASAGAAARKG